MTKRKPGINYVGISLDKSASMRGIVQGAMNDYNQCIQTIKQETQKTGQKAILSVVACGAGDTDRVAVELFHQDINRVLPANTYHANGRGTPLFDSVGELIENFESIKSPYKNTSFLVMVITDGRENASRKYTAYSIARKINKLQATDRWTFVFRVPRGKVVEIPPRKILEGFGIPAGNILEWDQTEQGFREATAQASAGLSTYYGDLSRGVTSTKNFFQTNIKSGDAQKIAHRLVNISNDVRFFQVKGTNQPVQIRDYLESMSGRSYKKGTAFYQLIKPEKVQDYKEIIVRNKKTHETYSGVQARTILGLPQVGLTKVSPGNHGHWDIFIQSTSVNRLLPPGSGVIVWDNHA